MAPLVSETTDCGASCFGGCRLQTGSTHEETGVWTVKPMGTYLEREHGLMGVAISVEVALHGRRIY
jgi:hypothetical protein